MTQLVKNLPANAGDTIDVGLISESGRSPGGGNGNPLQCSCLEKSHGQRNLEGGPWSWKESDTTERTHTSIITHRVHKSWYESTAIIFSHGNNYNKKAITCGGGCVC